MAQVGDMMVSEEQVARYKRIFDMFDINKDGVLQAKEIAAVAKVIGYSLPNEAVLEILGMFDKDLNGVLTFDEFVIAMVSHHRHTNAPRKQTVQAGWRGQVLTTKSVAATGPMSMKEHTHTHSQIAGEKLHEQVPAPPIDSLHRDARHHVQHPWRQEDYGGHIPRDPQVLAMTQLGTDYRQAGQVAAPKKTNIPIDMDRLMAKADGVNTNQDYNQPQQSMNQMPRQQQRRTRQPQQQYGAPPQQYGGHPQQYGAQSPQYGGHPQQYGAQPQQYGAHPQQYGGYPQQYGGPSNNAAPNQNSGDFQRQMEKMKADFRRRFVEFDRDRNGFITLEEAHQVLHDELGFSPDKTNSLVSQFDVNSDGRLSYEEFVSFYCKVLEKKNHIETAFKTFDKDNKGYVTIQDAKRILGGMLFDDAEVEALVKAHDTNNDGILQYEEFVHFWHT